MTIKARVSRHDTSLDSCTTAIQCLGCPIIRYPTQYRDHNQSLWYQCTESSELIHNVLVGYPAYTGKY